MPIIDTSSAKEPTNHKAFKLYNWAKSISQLSDQSQILQYYDQITTKTSEETQKAIAIVVNSSIMKNVPDIFKDNIEYVPRSRETTPPISEQNEEEEEEETPKEQNPPQDQDPPQAQNPPQNQNPPQAQNLQVTPTQSAPQKLSSIPKKRKIADKNDFTSIKKLLSANTDPIKYRIPNTLKNPSTKIELFTDIKTQLAKCYNSTSNSNESRYIIANNLLKLLDVTKGKTEGGKVKSSFYAIIKEKFDISQR